MVTATPQRTRPVGARLINPLLRQRHQVERSEEGYRVVDTKTSQQWVPGWDKTPDRAYRLARVWNTAPLLYRNKKVFIRRPASMVARYPCSHCGHDMHPYRSGDERAFMCKNTECRNVVTMADEPALFSKKPSHHQCLYCNGPLRPGATPGGEPTYDCTNDRCRWVGCAETMDAQLAAPTPAAPTLTPDLLNLLVAAYEHGLAAADGFHEDAHSADVLAVLDQVRAESERRSEQRTANWRRITAGQPLEPAPELPLTCILPPWLLDLSNYPAEPTPPSYTVS